MACTAIIERGWSEGMKASGLGMRVGRASSAKGEATAIPGWSTHTVYARANVDGVPRGLIAKEPATAATVAVVVLPHTNPPLGFYNAVENGTRPQKRHPARRAISSFGSSGSRWTSEAPCGTAHYLANNLAINRDCGRQIAVAIRLVAPSPP